MVSKQPLDPILYRNAEGDVTLIDIPTSIAAAQGTKDHPAFSRLLSSKPQEVPFAMNDPKSDDAKSKLAENTVDAALHEEYRSITERALNAIRTNFQGNWCHPRELFPEIQLKGNNRELMKRKDDQPGTTQDTFDDALSWRKESIEKSMARLTGLPQDLLPQLAEQCDSKHGDKKRFLVKYSSPGTADETNSEEEKDKEGYLPYEPLQYNLDDSVLRLTVLDNLATGKAAYTFRVPPRASCLSGDCSDVTSLRAAIRTIAQEYDTPRKFDLILLDPPYTNHSAKRKRAYSTDSLGNLKDSLLRMDLPIANNGILAVWITNKPAIRTMILGPGGIFENFNVGLIEEWIWVKTTVKGEPMFALDSSWRKPYEVLLVGKAATNPYTVAEPATDMKRRVIAGVPDLHSRKPCLKNLLESLMADPNSYTAIELFARHLVSGWFSYGNEPLRFQWDGCWAD